MIPKGSESLQRLLNARLSIDDVRVIASAAAHADWLEKPRRGRAGVTSPEVLEILTWLAPTKARSMRRHVGEVLDRISGYMRTIDLNRLLDQSDDSVSFSDWVTALADPRTATTIRRFREWELATLRFHAQTWDSESGQCAVAEMCPACIRETEAA